MSKQTKTVTEKMTELSELVSWFESDDFQLELALGKYKTAEVLAREIEHDLAELKNEVTVLREKFDT